MNNDKTTTTEQPLDSIKESVHRLVDQGQARATAIKNRVVSAKHTAVTKGTAYLDRTTDLIKAHPLKAIGIAFGVGYLGMRLFRR